MAAGCQIWGKANLLKAFTMVEPEFWAICQGKQFIYKGDSVEDLQGFLTLLEEGGSTSVYTLKYYESVNELSEVNDKTPCDGSVNFCMAESKMSGVQLYQGGGGDGVLLARIAKLEKQLSTPAEEPETIGSILMGFLKEPDKVLPLVQAWGMLTGRQMPMPAMGNALREVNAKSAGAIDESEPGTKLQRLERALNTLEKADPKFLDHLEILAGVAERDPEKFKQLIGMISLL